MATEHPIICRRCNVSMQQIDIAALKDDGFAAGSGGMELAPKAEQLARAYQCPVCERLCIVDLPQNK